MNPSIKSIANLLLNKYGYMSMLLKNIF